ncbi:hypothetical protein B0J13DRAFT_491767 [Dactylonectria estremocensis]|uniref:DUF8004 domain-containing protein n=1 Tax=Dactylonectria estremocensis TaxID=1079267 RepID=A0A9P9JLK4_9HYPO|nr:hypothetical protein B0J13DRAFT_491767 [Dactylonectria estremocensis]
MPSMTSSKSFRASIIPSVLRSNTDPESSASSSSSATASNNGELRKKLWKKSSTIDLSLMRDSRESGRDAAQLPGSNSTPPTHAATDKSSSSSSSSSTTTTTTTTTTTNTTNTSNTTIDSSITSTSVPSAGPGKTVPPQPRPAASNRKSKTWGNRLSSLLPTLMLPSTNTNSAPAVPKQPTTAPPPPPAAAAIQTPESTSTSGPVVTPALTKSSTPTDTSPASSTPSIVEPPTIRMADDDDYSLGVVQASKQSPRGSPPTLATFPAHDSDVLDISRAGNHPQIMAPIPPSPEMTRVIPSAPTVPPPAVPPPAIPVAAEQSPVEQSTDSIKFGKLRKENPGTRRRSSSLQHRVGDIPSMIGLKARTDSPASDMRGRRASSVQPASARGSPSSSRVPSANFNTRPGSSKDTESPTRGRLRRSWLPGGGRSRSNSMDVTGQSAADTWVLTDDTRAEYNASFLKNAEKVPELWNEGGNVYVFLYPRISGCGPSFKVPEFTVSSSYIFNELIQAEIETPTSRGRGRSFGGRDSLSVEDANRLMSPPSSPPPIDTTGELRLYLPTPPPSGTGQLAAPGQGSQQELDRLIAVRNLFAFLTGQPLVATKTKPTNFHAFLQIAGLLEEFGFTSFDGTTFGDAVDLSFGFYMDQMGLADCRHSREKTLEALILGERMRSLDLYNEAFAHAAGKYSAILDLRLPLFEQVSPQTRQGLERAHLDLVNRQHNVNVHLEQFEFPAFFSGIAASTSTPELRQVRFKVWRNSFNRMRHFVLGYYKSTFGNWPPKASSKKNPFSESGLNRLVLKVLYSDMCALYDLLVDRTNRTSRVMDEVPTISAATDEMTSSALRNILSEFDRSKPPVLPPIPYDTPKIPSPAAVLETYNSLSTKKQIKFDKNIKEHELSLILNKAYNYDTNSLRLPFLDQFKEFEQREARGKMSQDFSDQRYGYWLFLYAVIQSLPVLVVDAPGMSHTEGVEYFLCEPPMGNPPWMGDRQVRKMWYEVAGGGGLVELSTDAVLFSVEATYHRSHCWLAAKQWEGHEGDLMPPPPPELPMSPLEPPHTNFPDDEDYSGNNAPTGGPNTPSPPLGGPQVALRPRTHSPGGNRANQAWRSSIALGLEPVPQPPPSPFGERNSSLGGRPSSMYLSSSRSQSVNNLAAMGGSRDLQIDSSLDAANSGATFDDILGGGEEKAKPKKKGRFF